MGVVECDGAGGTFEKGHPAVAQWNVILKGADMTLTVEDETISQRPGDISYVTAGLDHSLASSENGKTYYIWFEHYVQEKGLYSDKSTQITLKEKEEIMIQKSENKLKEPVGENEIKTQVILDGASNRAVLKRIKLGANAVWYPELVQRPQMTQIFLFTGGTGYVSAGGTAYNITEPARFIPDFDKEKIFLI